MTRRHTLSVMGGDGVGPELVAEAVRLLVAVEAIDGFHCELRTFPHSGAHYRATGELLSDRAVADIAATESLLFGAVGDPQLPPGTPGTTLLRELVHRLDLTIGVRPGTLYADWLCPLKDRGAGSIDMVIVRDTSEDIFSGNGAQIHGGSRDEVTVALQAYTWRSIEGVLRHAFEMASRRRGRVTLVSQSNAIAAHGLWDRVARDLATDYSGVTLDQMYPDAMAALMVLHPDEIDVLATTLWLGGTLSDLMGAIVGGIGLIGSVRLNPARRFGLFEPAHGSAPKYTGKGVVSPLATFRALAMLLDEIGEPASARRIEQAIAKAITSGQIKSVSTRGPTRTTEATDAVIRCL